MLRHRYLDHRFVHYIPEELEPGIIYISLDYATAAHACCCGCGEQVITPFTLTDWKLTFDGETISLWPSIGNWNFTCRSHYIITHNRIREAAAWNDDQVDKGRQRDKQKKLTQYDNKIRYELSDTSDTSAPSAKNHAGWWEQIKENVGKGCW